MHNTPDAFQELADFCERHLEATRGREIGMTFGAAIQAMGRLASHPGNEDDPEWKRLNGRIEQLLLEFSTRFIAAYGWVGDGVKPVEPMTMQTNMIYDSGKSKEPRK